MQTEYGRALLACPEGRAAALNDRLRSCGYSPVDTANDLPSALAAVTKRRFALVLTTATLPGGDGVGLARQITALPLSSYPDVLILSPEGLRLPEASRLAEYGAAMLTAVEGLADAAEALRKRERPLTPARSARLEGLLDRLGVPCHKGRDVLTRAVALTWRDRENIRNICSAAGEPFGMTGKQAERALRHVIEAAWRGGKMEEQQSIFGDTIDARRGRPTCGEMIAHLADILRREG